MSKTIKIKNKFKAIFFMSYGLTIRGINFQKEKNTFIPVFEIGGERLKEILLRYRLGVDIISILDFEYNSEKLEKLINNEYEIFLEDKKDEGK